MRLQVLLLAGALVIEALVARALGQDGVTAVFVMKVDGTDMRQVASIEGCQFHGSPRFSHDGTRLAFHAAPQSGVRRSYTVGLDGMNLRELSTGALHKRS